MSSKPVTQRKGKIDPAAPGISVNEIGTPGSNNVMSSRASNISLSSRASANSCPSVQPRAPVLRKNSPITNSSNGLSSKTVGANNKPPPSNGSRKPPQPTSGKVVCHAYLKASKSTPLAEPESRTYAQNGINEDNANNEYLNGNKEGGEGVGAIINTFEGNGYCGEITPAEDSLFFEDKKQQPNDLIDKESKDLEKLSSNPIPNGVTPLPSGPIKHFLGRENGSQKKTNSLPIGFGMCYGVSNSASQSQPNNYNEEPSSPSSSTIVGIGELCSPTCNGLHYCLQMIGAGKFVPLPNKGSKGSPATPQNQGTTKWSHTINGVNVNGHGHGGMSNGHPHDIFGSRNKSAKPSDISFQEAFSHLLKIRNILNESGLCSLEDHQHVAAVETLLLKVFSQGGGSKFHN